MKRVKGHRYLYRRGDYLVFRRGVPKRVRVAFGKTEVLVSLGTGSISEARHILSRELEKFDRLLAQATGMRSPAAVLDPVKREPTTEEAEKGVRVWFEERVGRLIKEVDTITDEGRAVNIMQDYDALSENAAVGIRIGSKSAMMTDWIVEALIERFGWHIAPRDCYEPAASAAACFIMRQAKATT